MMLRINSLFLQFLPENAPSVAWKKPVFTATQKAGMYEECAGR